MVAVLFSLWYLISLISFSPEKRIEQGSSLLEKKLGELVVQSFKREYGFVTYAPPLEYLDSLTRPLLEANDIDPESITFYIANDTENINAFALPDRQIVIFSGMVDFTQNPMELKSVIAHEVAHIEEDHVMKKLTREIGLTVLLSVISGNPGMDLIRNIFRVITTSSYDRAAETEADEKAIQYLSNARIDPHHFIVLLERFAHELDTWPAELRWISTHPTSESRSKHLYRMVEEKELSGDFPDYDQEQWNAFRKGLNLDAV